MYQRRIKRPLDIALSAVALLALWPLLLFIALLVRLKLGSPVIFRQERPGMKDATGKEKIFTMYKFRTMTNAKDAAGNFLSDAERLTHFGQFLRKTSVDELPQLVNILKGDMSIIGPRPHLVRDLLFMTDAQRVRHNVRPGLSGLAQVNGRNGITWEEKFTYDVQYVRKVRFAEDIRIILLTICKVLFPKNISCEGMATTEPLGDYLKRTGRADG